MLIFWAAKQFHHHNMIFSVQSTVFDEKILSRSEVLVAKEVGRRRESQPPSKSARLCNANKQPREMSFLIPRLDTHIVFPSPFTCQCSVHGLCHRYVQLSHRLAIDRTLRPVHAGSSTTRANMPVSSPAVPAPSWSSPAGPTRAATLCR
jgi:hypothetical protein